jgi:hypothetical protein
LKQLSFAALNLQKKEEGFFYFVNFELGINIEDTNPV